MSGNLNLKKHPIFTDLSAQQARVTITVNDQPLEVKAGISLAAALWAEGIPALRRDEATGEARGLHCGIGHCCECRVTLDGVEDVRSCLVMVRDGLRVELGFKPQEDENAC